MLQACALPTIPEQYLDTINRLTKLLAAKEQPSSPVFDISLANECYYSSASNYYLIGHQRENKYLGPCLFYLPNTQQQDPVVIMTSFSQQSLINSKTLLIYKDRSYYLGEVGQFNHSIQGCVAHGQGMYANQSFIYKGQFKNGVPNGWGLLKTKNIQVLGNFKEGVPEGQVLENTVEGLFVGFVASDGTRTGKVIKQDREEEINQ